MDRRFALNLIRHLPTAGNSQKKYIGWTDEPILPVQVEPVPHLKEVWGSDLQRCRQTASLLFPAAAYYEDSGWRECNFGAWEEKTYNQLVQDPLYRNWIDDPYRFTPPDGESLEALAKRIDQTIKSMPDREEFTVVTHGGPIRYLLAKATGGKFQEQKAHLGYSHRLVWKSRSAYEEGALCTSFSVEPLTESGNM
ncbi:histidine phosphatase family protein [Planococcus salinus]|uniref:Histidine phosphatase family protein n=1 Tax=Planococcus salinus TaxID=1848460 RepID=A0A3M8P8L8_9BACL|nr:histidine phosphatase family protein [Planococcus salinus]RNF40049.1 histidine phosphatase family protein [Planococcus salinus]